MVYSPVFPLVDPPHLCWIDTDGSYVCASEEAANQNDNAPFPARSTQFPFFDMGLVRLRGQDSVLEVTWDIDSVRAGSVGAAVRMIEQCRAVSEIRLRYYKNGWACEVRQKKEAIERLEALSEFGGVTVLPSTQIIEVDVAGLMDPAAIRVYENWHLGRPLDDRLVDHVLKLDREARFIHVGEQTALRKLVPNGSFIGESTVGEFPSEYEKRVCQSYLEVLGSGRPRCEQIQGLVQEGSDLRWIRYERVMVPHDEGLLCVAAFRDNIEIGFLGAH